MSTRNLDHLFRPASVALIGASARAGSVGNVVARNLLAPGRLRVHLVNPRGGTLHGQPVHADVASLPEVPDLAVICTPPQTVPDLVAGLAARGTRAAVVITAGFGELGAEGQALQQRLLDAARPALLRVVGPNCLGVLVPGSGLDASFAHLPPKPGGLAFLAQSGAVVTSIIDWAAPRDIGFSHLVSLGAMADVDFGDLLDYLAGDPGTTGILLYIEAVTQPRKFMSAARAAARVKPVVVIKAGRQPEGARAAASHTGALAGADAVYEAAFRRAGMLRVRTLDELFDAVATLSAARAIGGDRLAILTNGGGMGVLATDTLMESGGHLAALAPETLARLDALLPATWSRGNPVDIIGDAPGSRYAVALEVLLQDPGADAVLVLNCPTAIASTAEAAEAVVATVRAARQRGIRRPVLTSWVGGTAARQGCTVLEAAGLPSYHTPDQAVRAFAHMAEYRRNQEALMQTPPTLPRDFVPDPEAARALIARALADGREWLAEPEVKGVLAAYGVPVAASRAAATAEEAGAAAAKIGRPVALKILSRDITHKTDVGGVVLNLTGAADVAQEAAAMLSRVGHSHPQARLDGFLVQEMVRRPNGRELIVGIAEDAQFGPVVLFGQGGTAVELIDDKALALPPLNLLLARDLIDRTRVSRLLRGYRGRPAADLDAIALTLVKIAQLATDLAEIVELDINPLVADEAGVVALDARIRVAAAAGPAAERLAIRPYPSELEDIVRLPDGTAFRLRPIRPEDEPALVEAYSTLDAAAMRMRFMAAIRSIGHQLAARLTQIDYDREMALVLTDPEPGPDPGPGPAAPARIYGIARLAADPNNEAAEFALTVRRDWWGRGLGRLLMTRLIAGARGRGLATLFGYVLPENTPMLAISRDLGFRISGPEEPGAPLRVELRLDPPAG